MTKAQLLAQADSRELSSWFVFFKVKAEREEEHREAIAFERRILKG